VHPSERSDSVAGESQGANGAASMRHSKVAAGSSASNAKLAERELTAASSSGAALRVVSGGVRSGTRRSTNDFHPPSLATAENGALERYSHQA